MPGEHIENTALEAATTSPQDRVLYFILAMATASMLALALPGYEMWYLSFVALVPLLVVLQSAPAKTTFLVSWLSGWAFFIVAYSWLQPLTLVGVPLVALYMGSWVGLFAVVVKLVTRGRLRVPFVIAVPVVWVALEMARGLPIWGFNWHYVGHALYRQTTLIQIADFAGVSGVTFVVLVVNAAIARIIHLAASQNLGKRKQITGASAGALFAIAVVAGALGYGSYRINETIPLPGPTISVVQGNIEQDLAEFASPETAKDLDEFKVHEDLTRRLTGVTSDMIVWPEGAVPPTLEIVRPAEPAWLPVEENSVDVLMRRKVHKLVKDYGRPFLVGSSRWVVDKHGIRTNSYNTACYFDGSGDHPRVYRKIHLVPFGEYMPFRSVGWIRAIVEYFMPEGYVTELSPGRELTIMQLKEWSFATPICYEDTTTSLVRGFRQKGVDFIVNLTNDGWFWDTAELDQHLANSVFRTVENRIGLVRSANTGISAFVSPTGVITSVLKDERTGKHRCLSGVLTDTVLTDGRRTFYTDYGELFSISMLCCTGAAVVCQMGFRRVRLRNRK